eukprot:1741368-Prymnesium_polylepis.1
MKLSRHPPHDSNAHSAVCRCGRRPLQCCRWRRHRSREVRVFTERTRSSTRCGVRATGRPAGCPP